MSRRGKKTEEVSLGLLGSSPSSHSLDFERARRLFRDALVLFSSQPGRIDRRFLQRPLQVHQQFVKIMSQKIQSTRNVLAIRADRGFMPAMGMVSCKKRSTRCRAATVGCAAVPVSSARTSHSGVKSHGVENQGNSARAQLCARQRRSSRLKFYDLKRTNRQIS